MPITAKELAEKLQLSPAAVSMALNGKPGVSRETRQLVLETARQYGYDFARLSRKKQRSGNVYLIYYKKHGAVLSDTAFFSALSEGVQAACKNEGLKLNLCYLFGDDPALPKELERILYSDCCGLILLATEMQAQDFAPFSNLKVPLVILDNYYDTVTGDYVLINNVRGAYLATEHLLQRYHTQPGYLRSAYRIGNFHERANGFYQAIRAYGLSTSKSVTHELTPSIEGACSDFLECLDRGDELARCYFVDNDLIAIGAMRALQQRGKRIPEDVAIIGFDNIAACELIDPPLTTVHVPKLEFGQVAVERLRHLIETGSHAPLKIELSPSLVHRASG